MKNRFTAKWWESTPVEEDKLGAILDCAYYTPSKQGHYDFEIYAITDSVEGKEFKQWLYWEGSSCLNYAMSPTSSGPGYRRYNGQVLAPVVLIWLAKEFPRDLNPYGESDWIRTNNDCHISATIALCQAEELGLSTGFCGSIIGKSVSEKLGRPEMRALISLGIGYAVSTTNPAVVEVVKDGVTMGFDLPNLDASIGKFPFRNKPPKSTMIRSI